MVNDPMHTREKRLLKEKEVAAMLGLSQRTLQGLRHRGGGPRFVKLGGKRTSTVRYRLEDIEEWVCGLGE